MAELSVVMMTWNRPGEILNYALGTLAMQFTKPYEVLVVDAGPTPENDIDHYVKPHRVHGGLDVWTIERTMPEFNLSQGINIGIKATDPGVDYVMTTCPEMLFSRNFVDRVLGLMETDTFLSTPCGFLPEGIEIDYRDFYEDRLLFDELAGLVDKPKKPSIGAVLVAPRSWWFRSRGYDEENYPFAYADSDVVRRARMSGLRWRILPWHYAQVLHVWHEPSELASELGGTIPDESETDWVRNPDGWGET